MAIFFRVRSMSIMIELRYDMMPRAVCGNSKNRKDSLEYTTHV